MLLSDTLFQKMLHRTVLFQVCLNLQDSTRFEDIISAYMHLTIAGPASRLTVQFMAYQQLRF